MNSARPPGGGDLAGLWRNREFRALWVSNVVSAGGDRLALVAVTLLVYDRTRSPLWSAVAFAAGTLPYLVGGALFAGAADRYSRRAVMLAADVIRAVLTAVMALPGVPLPGLIVLLYLTGIGQPPFDAARSAIVRDVLDGRSYVLAATVMQVTFRLVLIAGAGVAGVTVAFTGARPALAADAASFLASAALIRARVRSRPPAAAPQDATLPGRSRRPVCCNPRGRGPGGVVSGIRLVFGDPVLRTVMLMGWLAAFYEVPEGVAAPYAAAAGGGPAAAGLLLASGQSMILTATWYARLPEDARRRQLGPLAVAAPLILVATAAHPGIAVSMVILAAAGIAGTYQITVNMAFVEAAPPAQRATAFSIASMGLVAGQGVGFAVAGWAAQAVAPSTVTAAAGGIGAVAALVLAVSWRRLSHGNPATACGE